MLTHLYQAGKLEEVAGVALGVFRKCDSKIGSAHGERSLSRKEVLYDKLYNLGVPVIYGLSFGHIENKYTIPFGIKRRVGCSKTNTYINRASCIVRNNYYIFNNIFIDTKYWMLDAKQQLIFATHDFRKFNNLLSDIFFLVSQISHLTSHVLFLTTFFSRLTSCYSHLSSRHVC